MEETGWFDTAGAAFLNKIYGERNVVTANKEVKNWEGVMTDLGYNIPDELKERAEDRWIDMVSGGMTDFALMIAVMALTKRPIAGAVKRLFGGFGPTKMLGRAFAKESLALEGTPMAQLAAKNIVIAESKALSWGIETLAAVGTEIGAGMIYNSIDKSMGGHGMPLSIMAGFGFMNPQMKYLMNSKLLAPIMKGDAKGLISMKQLPALMLKGGARQGVQAAGGTAVALAVELFDAAVIQGNLDAETFGEITDLEKASVLFTQMMLTGYFNHAVNVPPMYREFGRNLMNEICGYSGSTEVVNIAKKYKIKNKNASDRDWETSFE